MLRGLQWTCVFTWLVAALLLHLHIPSHVVAQNNAETSEKCDRAHSREANLVISTVLQPRIQKLGYTLPEGCPLDASKDIFKVQEAHKLLMRKNVWKCTWDEKVFRGENFIDLHMERKHSHETDPDASTCVASMCGPLHCDFFEHSRKGTLANLQTIPCHGRTMDVNKDLCHQLAHNCFPLAGGEASQHMHAFMMQTFCEAATCRWPRRQELLKPLTRHQHDGQYLRLVLIGATVIVLIVIYSTLAVQWSSKTASESNSVQRFLEALGFVKPKEQKFL